MRSEATMSTLDLKTATVFEPLLGESYRYLGAWGGRGSAKSHFFGGLLVERLILNPKLRAVCVREYQKSLKDSAYRLICDKINDMDVAHMFLIFHDRIETKSGGVIKFIGMQDHTADTIKSLEGYSVAWVEEAQTLSSKSLELLRPTIRTDNSQIWFSWNPMSKLDPVDLFLRGGDLGDNIACVVNSNWRDNPWLPDVLDIERNLDKVRTPGRYPHIWEGEYEPQAVGAIWNQSNISEQRVNKTPDNISRVLIAIDPAVSSKEHSDEHGIVVVATGHDGLGYLIEDGSIKGTPKQWAEKAITLYDLYEADGIVIEKNQGGDMCRHTLDTVRANLPIIEVHATKGKHVRAEPISALYSLGRIKHVGIHAKLESQMCQMTSEGYEGKGSPDRLDALVWGFTELFPRMVQRESSKPRQTQAIME